MIETREDFAQINATLADAVPDEHEELLVLIEALRWVARAAYEASHSDVVDWGLQLKLLGRKVGNLPQWILREE